MFIKQLVTLLALLPFITAINSPEETKLAVKIAKSVVEVYSTDKTGPIGCTGVIVSNQYILTDAHCVDKSVVQVLTKAGPSPKVLAIKKHPNYNHRPDCSGFDVALVKVTKLDFSKFALQQMDLATTTPLVSTKVAFMGMQWKETRYPNPGSGTAKLALYETRPPTVCKSMWTELCSPGLLNQTICTQGLFHALLTNGQCGGPLVHQDRLVGLAIASGGDGNPSAFTDITKGEIRKFIIDNMN